MPKNQQSKIYFINNDGDKELVNPNKILIEFADGANVTIETLDQFDFHTNHNEICIRGYYGEKEYEQSNKCLIFNVRPGACNLVRVSTELFDSKPCDDNSSNNNDKQNDE